MVIFILAFLLALILPFYFLHYLPHSFPFLLHLKFVDYLNLLRTPHKECMDSSDEFSLSTLSRTTPTCSPLFFEMTIFQEFDSKWDGILLSMTKIPHDVILEGLYKLRIRESEKLKTALELYDLEIHQKKIGPDYHRLKTRVKRRIEHDIRNNNFGARNGNYERNAVVKNPGTKQRVQRIFGDCWQWESNGQCITGDKCSFRHDVSKRGKSSPSNPSPNSFMQQSERKSSRTRSPRGKSTSGRMSR